MNQPARDPQALWALESQRRAAARIDCALVVDAKGTRIPFGTLVLERDGSQPPPEAGIPLAGRWRVAAALPTADPAVATRFSGVPTLSLARHALIPGLVNAHTHLDLTHIGPREYDAAGGFVGWVDVIRRERAVEGERIEASVQRGVQLCLAGGTVAIGDIAGAVAGRASVAAALALAKSPLAGVSFVEFFAIGRGEERGIAAMRKALEDAPRLDGPIRLGLQPHAPNTVSPRAYSIAADESANRNMPLATHIAETPEEREFVAQACGPQRSLLERLDLWDSAILAPPQAIGQGLSPVRHLAPVFQRARFLLAHANLVDDADIQLLAATAQSVAYCPRAHSYFQHESGIGPHRYRDMLAAGVNVALGTDSLVNLPAEAARSGISILDEMRWLYGRDGTDPLTLLAMGTVNGAAALELNPAAFTFQTGAELAGLNAVEIGHISDPAAVDILTSTGPVQLLHIRK